MSDPAFRPLLAAFAAPQSTVLWIVDEQLDAAAVNAVSPRAGLSALTNRCDIAQVLQQRGFDTALSDFDFAPWDEVAFDVVAYRVSKEKAVVHHVINAALTRLRVGGELWLTGAKNEGIKTYLDKAARVAGGACVSEKHGAVWLGRVTRGEKLGGPLDDQRYAEMRELVAGDGWRVWSKPGIYGWQKIDTGSQLLAQYFDAAWQEPPASVLDIGCGYGYLSLCAARAWPDAAITATDNNVAAVAACSKNLEARASVILTDCADGIDARFDAVLCNPPFHQGFDIEGDLTTRFLTAARRCLNRHGRALFVVNQFIPLERKAAPLFRRVRELQRAHGFKIFLLEP